MNAKNTALCLGLSAIVHAGVLGLGTLTESPELCWVEPLFEGLAHQGRVTRGTAWPGALPMRVTPWRAGDAVRGPASPESEEPAEIRVVCLSGDIEYEPWCIGRGDHAPPRASSMR